MGVRGIPPVKFSISPTRLPVVNFWGLACKAQSKINKILFAPSVQLSYHINTSYLVPTGFVLVATQHETTSGALFMHTDI